MSKFSQSRAFIVELSDETDRSAGLPSGRIEHVDSGLRGRFSCREELWQFIERVLSKEAVSEAAEMSTSDNEGTR